ncbi:tyrosine-protein kinase-like otk isoform X2 [Symsagittifera roscoffensis]|uniref:tyrosine-protein kinase-like otk isoform X2 n=1 Tax=Symsagittifera roscoffensis TaxID=84072 RepID=UPI00307BC04A
MDPVFFKLSQVLLFLASVWTTRSCNYSGRPPYKLDLGSKLMIESECSQAVENTVLWFFIPIVNKNPQLPAQNYTSVGSEGILIVNEVTKLNNGTYYFSALENGVRSESAKIPVIIAWEGSETSVSLFAPSAENLQIGATVKLVCNFDSNPKPEVTWLKNGNKVTPSDNVELQADILTIKSMTQEDVASYMCRVNNIFLERPFMIELPTMQTPTKQIPNVQLLQSSTQCPLQVVEGQSVWVDFKDIGGSFLLNGRRVYNSAEIYTFPQNGSVYFPSIDRSVESVSVMGSKLKESHSCNINVTYIDPPRLDPNIAYFGSGSLITHKYICTAGDSNPPPILFQWFRNNILLNESSTKEITGTGFEVKRIQNAIILNLPDNFMDLDEKFSCHIGNGLKTLSMDLKFQHVVHVPNSQDVVSVLEGESARLQCLSNSSDVSMFHFEWSSFNSNEDASVKTLLAKSRKSNHGNVLTVRRVSVSDSRRLTCAAFGNRPEIASFTAANTITLKVHKRFKFLNPTSWTNTSYVHYIRAKQTESITCNAEGPHSEPPSIRWDVQNGGELPAGVSLNESNQLVFRDADPAQNGNYRCMARLAKPSPVGGEEEPTVLTRTFNVRVVKQIELEVAEHPVDQKVERGDQVQFHCKAIDMGQGEQQPDTKWWFKAAKPARRSDDKADAYSGSSSSSGGLTTAAPVSVDTIIKKSMADAKQKSTTGTTTDTQPPVQSRIKVVNGTTLVIDNVQSADQGFYWCIFNRTFNFGSQSLKTTNEATLAVIIASSGSQSIRTILIAVACAVGYILFMLALTIYCRKRRIASKNKQLAKLANANNGLGGDPNVGNGQVKGQGTLEMDCKQPLMGSGDLRPDLVTLQKRSLNVEKLQFPRHELQTTSLLGRGEFGDVFLAVAMGLNLSDTGSVSRSMRSNGSQQTSTTATGGGQSNEQLVMVKSLLHKDKALQEKFHSEMEQYAQLRSVHVSRLFGVCTETEPLYAIFEYTEWGDMKRFLMSTKGVNGLPQTPAMSLSHKLHLAYQALRGLEYFANNKLVHKDVAARNFLLTSDLVVKLSCASLCKDVYRSEYYEYHNVLIPLRWMPLEAVYDESYSQMSDAYSFGVTLWEIFSLGVLPYPELTNEQVLKGLTVGELKLDVPPAHLCPPQVAEIMFKCWEECAMKRPSFSQMLAILTSVNVEDNSTC